MTYDFESGTPLKGFFQKIKNGSLVRVTKVGFYLCGGIWAIFVLLILMRAFTSNGNTVNWGIVVLGVLMLGNAGFFVFTGWALGKGWRWVFFLGLAGLIVNILLTYTDQVGFFDLLTVIIDVILLWLLLSNRSVFTSGS